MMGMGADDELWSVSSSITCSVVSWDGEGWFCDMDRTTSPLQIGHVRRRVVSHGVLKKNTG